MICERAECGRHTRADPVCVRGDDSIIAGRKQSRTGRRVKIDPTRLAVDCLRRRRAHDAHAARPTEESDPANHAAAVQ